MALAAVIGCTQEQPEQPLPDTEQPSLTARDANSSKTALDPSNYVVSWTGGDALSVFNAPAGTAGWSGNLEFTLDDAEAGRFVPASGVVVPFEEGVLYDWKAVYPYTASLSSPSALPSIPLSQTQNGKNSTAHLAGYDVLYGETSATREPTLMMHHSGTLLKWTAYNDSELPFTVTGIRFFNGTETYELTVSGDAELYPSYSGDFYMLARPFSFNASDQLEISVITSVGTETQIKTFPSAKSFDAGKYNTARIVCDPAQSVTHFHVAKNASGKWRLYKNGEEFFINGGAVNNFYDKIAEFGGNALRTYSTAQIEPALAAARANGTYVLVGLPVGRERDGFDFGNASAIASQKANLTSIVSSYAADPAVLGWIIGNELDSSYSDARVWDVVGELSDAIKAIDPYHLTTTALAGAKKSAISQIKAQAPSLDFISVNSYYPATNNVKSNLINYGWDKPWAITEFGPSGTWGLSTSSEPPLTAWGACVEQTSSQKARIYKDLLASAINGNKDNGCIGSFAFVWGYQTHGAVLTWYGLFDENGYSFAAVDELQYGWTGSYPEKLAPVINNRHSMLIDDSLIGDDNITLVPGSVHSAKVTATSPCGAALRYKWLIVKEGATSLAGMPALIQNETSASISFNAPKEGNYRLIVFVYDDANRKVASGAIPFKVSGSGLGTNPDGWKAGHQDW